MSAPKSPPNDALLTVGYGTLQRRELIDLLQSAAVGVLVDVRRYPLSRRHPDLAGPTLATALPSTGIAYRWEERLGGRRHLPRGEPTLDPWWTVEAFRGYAAHTRTREFQAALGELLEANARSRVAIMCSESVWWRCHRRLIADIAVAGHQIPVWHLMRQGRAVPHRVAAGVRVRADGVVVWDRTAPDGARVGDAMIRTPKTCDSTATVGEVRQLLTDDHVHVALLVNDGRLVTAIERCDIPRSASQHAPARWLGRLAGRVIGPAESLELAHHQMLASGQRRLAVTDHEGSLLGLLCLKRSQTGFCTEQDVQDRVAQPRDQPKPPAPT
jgi:CBS domain-containing protein